MMSGEADRMKALTLTQPWATLVILGIKKMETRSWYPRDGHWDRLAIHAGKGWSRDDREFADELHARGILPIPSNELPHGVVLGTVQLSGLARSHIALRWEEATDLEQELGDYSAGRYAWLLSAPQPFAEPIPARGALGLWEWERPA